MVSGDQVGPLNPMHASLNSHHYHTIGSQIVLVPIKYNISKKNIFFK